MPLPVRKVSSKFGKNMTRKIGYLALSMYLLLVSLSAVIPNLMVPNTLMALIAFIASLGIFLDIFVEKT